MLSPLIVNTLSFSEVTLDGKSISHSQSTQENNSPSQTYLSASPLVERHSHSVLQSILTGHEKTQTGVRPALCKYDAHEEGEEGEEEEESLRTLIDPDVLRDVIIGLSDGLTVPFGLTAGLSSLGSSKLVVIAGLAELISGAISMGIGGYLASEAEQDQFRYLQRKIRSLVSRSTLSQMERKVHEILAPIGVREDISKAVAYDLVQIENRGPMVTLIAKELKSRNGFWRNCARFFSRERESYGSISAPEEEALTLSLSKLSKDAGMTAFLLKFGEGQEEVPTSRLYISAFTIGISYFIGGLIPMAPYFFIEKAQAALGWSILVMTITLIIFGVLKAYFTGAQTGFVGYMKASLATIAVGGAAAAASYLVVAALEAPNSSLSTKASM